jgi:hypothetical protein
MNMSDQDLDWLSAQQPHQVLPDPGARERALLALVQHTTSRPGRRGFSTSRLRTPMFGLTLATGIGAIATAVVLSASGHAAGLSGAGRLSRPAQGLRAVVSQHHFKASPLVRLADYVSQSNTPAGDATLVQRTTVSGSNSVTVYDLYTDNGQYFFSPTQSGLGGQVSEHHNLAGGLFAREIAAAKLAATGNVQTAAQDMADAPDPSHVISPEQKTNPAVIAAKEAATCVPQEGNLYDNWVWEDAQDAIIAGSGDPQVRAGVLQILATLPGVTVTNGTSDGQPTLVLAAGSPELGHDYTEQLTINANTGVPIQFIGGPTSGPPSATVNYNVTRVTLANLPAGTASNSN